MSSNKKAKERLIKKYGNMCFIDRLRLRKDKKRRYRSKKKMSKMQELTFHHIKEKSKGGKATVENGALLSAENHEWFNRQSKESQAKMNRMFQEYKRQIDLGIAIIVPETGVVDIKQIDIDMDDCIEIEVKKYNRAEFKQMMQNIRQEYVDR